MVQFNTSQQRMIAQHNCRKEIGAGVTIAGVSGQSFTVATKLRKIYSGFGVMDTDGMPCKATVGLVSSGQVAMTRLGPISTSADTATFTLHGL